MAFQYSRRFGVTLGLLIPGLLATAFTCERAESVARALPAGPEKGLYASDQVEFDDVRDFYARTFGRDEYSTAWAESERYRSGSATSERLPYLDSWYPEASGGTDVNSALKVYDRAFYNSEPKAAKWEAEQHGNTTVSWYGHCNGTSAASIRYQNPQRSVYRPAECTPGTNGCVEFTPADVRALLSEVNMNAMAKFISGERCRLTRAQIDSRPLVRSNPLTMDACEDVNPGSFHTALVNFIGRMKQPLIFDYNQDEEVWNYPIHAYSFETGGPLNEAQAITELGLAVDKWVFNPKAVSWQRVTMTVYYRTSTFDFNGAGTIPPTLDAKVYTYILELDDRGQILGGEWVGASRSDHPDFIWMPFQPDTPTGDKGGGNPFLSNQEVTKIWAESVGFNPNDPFHDKPNNTYDVRFFPSNTDLEWGEAAGYYHLILDGRRSGSAFLGKKTHLRIEVSDPLKTEASVDILVNGQAISTAAPKNGRLDVLFDPQAGINIINLRWNSAKVDGAELNRDFRFYAM